MQLALPDPAENTKKKVHLKKVPCLPLQFKESHWDVSPGNMRYYTKVLMMLARGYAFSLFVIMVVYTSQ